MALPPLLETRSRRERAALRRRLDGLHRRLDRRFLDTDPLAFVHRYASPDDREIVGFVAASLAFGNVVAIRASLESLLRAVGPSPARFVDSFDPRRDNAFLAGIYHRWIREQDLSALFVVLRRIRERSGSIGLFFMEGYRPGDPDIGPSLASFSERALALAVSGTPEGKVAGLPETDVAGVPDPTIAEMLEAKGAAMRRASAAAVRGSGVATMRRSGGAGTPVGKPTGLRVEKPDTLPSRARIQRRGTLAPFFPSPRNGSACKRLNLYLRWMVRSGDGLDVGLWTGVARRQLVLPLDTHLARLTRALGLTRRRTPGWKMAVEATRALALLDPDDPVKYDFSLSRIGILDLCLHGRDPLDCRACPAPRPRIRRTPRPRARRAPRGSGAASTPAAP